MYLLDTNVVSELRRQRPHGAVIAWLVSIESATLFLSVMTLGEIQTGIERTRAQDPVKARDIEEWADKIPESFDILPIDIDTIRLWARLMNGRPSRGYEDMMILATGIIHGLPIATRNVKDFQGFDVAIVDPFKFGEKSIDQ